jgi:hypothetical protein
MHQKNVDLQQQLSPPVLTKSPTRSYARSRGSNRLPPPFFRGSRPERPVATDSSDAPETAADLTAEFEAPALASEAPHEPTGFEPPPGFDRDIPVAWAPASEWYSDASTGDIAADAAEPDVPTRGESGTAAAAEADNSASWDPYRIADPEPSAFSVDQPDASLWALEFGVPASDAELDSEDEQVAGADVAVDAHELSAASEDAEAHPERPAPDEGQELACRVATQLDELADQLRENGMAALTRQSDADELARVIAAVIAGFRSREHE